MPNAGAQVKRSAFAAALWGLYAGCASVKSEYSAKFAFAHYHFGDTLLLEGAAEDIKRLAQEFAFVVISQPTVQPFRRRHAPIAVVTILGLVPMAGFGLAPLFVLSLVAAATLLVTRTIDAEEAFAFVQGRLLVLIFSMLAIGAGLHHAGAVALVVEVLTPVIAGLSPFLLIWCFFY